MMKTQTRKINRYYSRPRRSTDDKVFYAISYTIVGILTLLVLYPLIYILSCSFSSANAVSTGQVVLCSQRSVSIQCDCPVCIIRIRHSNFRTGC